MAGHNPTHRSKLEIKRHILTDKDSIPLSTVITSPNTNMMLLLQSIQLIASYQKTIIIIINNHHQQAELRNRSYVLIKHIIPKK